jgi:molybdopterin-guanine dinucleotide biosynthesis protein A
MGRPKALVDLGGRPLVAWVARALEEICEILVVAIAADPGEAAVAGERDLRDALSETTFAARPGGLLFARDAAPDLGPVAGLLAGLSASPADLVLVAACDLPFLSEALVAGLFDLARGTPAADVVAARREGFWEPMPCVLRRERMAAVYAAQLARGDLRPTSSWGDLRVVAVEGDALRRLDVSGHSFVGVNDPSELAAARARLGRHPS